MHVYLGLSVGLGAVGRWVTRARRGGNFGRDEQWLAARASGGLRCQDLGDVELVLVWVQRFATPSGDHGLGKRTCMHAVSPRGDI
jgi:hypothetical protein